VTLRHWLTAGSLGHFYDDPSQREHLKPEAQWEVESGLQLSAMDVYRASANRSAVYQAADQLFKDYDYLLLPTAQVFPFAVDVHWPQEINGRKMDTYHRWMEVCSFATLIGCPVINVPVGFNQDGCLWACKSSAGIMRIWLSCNSPMHTSKRHNGWVSTRQHCLDTVARLRLATE
jgi:amidase